MNDTLKKGLFVGTIQSIWLFGGFSILRSASLDIPQSTLRALTGVFSLVILFVGILYGIKRTRDNSKDNDLTYWKAVKTGVTISLVVACMVSSFSVFYLTLINPGFAADMVKEAEQSLKQSGATPEEIAQQLDKVRSEFSSRSQVITGLVLQSTMGTLFSLILSIFLRSKKQKNQSS